jgi:2-polyprenyl-3-methyl-5-hydroxy-6-metoxy-1,4-benzoquinol methylase
MDEIQNIENRYRKRKDNPHKEDFYFQYFAKSERELKYAEIVNKRWNQDIENCKLLEIGAGGGDNLLFFHRLGLSWRNLYANELLSDRISLLKEKMPYSTILPGNAMELEFEEKFDIILQSTVFTSILDNSFKKNLASKMMTMLKKDGIILWYDFKYNNPYNEDVKGIKKSEIKQLFSGAKEIMFYRTTLAPPIGRRIGRQYNLINFLFPFLRTHIIAVIKI